MLCREWAMLKWKLAWGRTHCSAMSIFLAVMARLEQHSHHIPYVDSLKTTGMLALSI